MAQDAIRIATDRVASGSIDGQISLAVADDVLLPFKATQYDAISHSDVLCCLAPKRGVLKECGRVIRRGGKCEPVAITNGSERLAPNGTRRCTKHLELLSLIVHG